MIEVVHFAPGTSPHLAAWRDAAQTAGMRCQVDEPTEHGDAAGTTWILDLTGPDAAITPDQIAGNGVLARAVVLHDAPDGDAATALREAGAIAVVAPDDANAPRLLQTLRRVAGLEAEVERRRGAMQKLNQIGYALSEVTDLDELLRLILAGARDLLQADSGSVYLIEHPEDDDDRPAPLSRRQSLCRQQYLRPG